jgi:transcriptional regulator with XRE-family HTH domain
MPRRTVIKYGPHPIDVHVGGRVRMRRTMLGLTQERLGQALGLTFQQIQKNEHGINRIGSSRLYQLSRILDVPVSFFFDDMPAFKEDGTGPAKTPAEPDPLLKLETLKLVQAYCRISDKRVRKQLFETIKAMARSS